MEKKLHRPPSFGEDPENLHEQLSPKQINEVVHEETSNDACNNSSLGEHNNGNVKGPSELDFSGLVR